MKIDHSARPLFGCAFLLALAGCGGLESSAQEAVRDNLKDPESALFGPFYYNSDTKKACLEVNAKNSMGGYVGDKQVRLQRDGDGWRWVYESEASPEECRENWADKKDS